MAENDLLEQLTGFLNSDDGLRQLQNAARMLADKAVPPEDPAVVQKRKDFVSTAFRAFFGDPLFFAVRIREGIVFHLCLSVRKDDFVFMTKTHSGLVKRDFFKRDYLLIFLHFETPPKTDRGKQNDACDA